MHFAFNPNCQPATFVANFATKDPGIQTFYNSLTSVPNNILHASTGIPESNWAQLKSQYPLVTTPGTGDQSCMAKCGLNFLSVSSHSKSPFVGNLRIERSSKLISPRKACRQKTWYASCWKKIILSSSAGMFQHVYYSWQPHHLLCWWRWSVLDIMMHVWNAADNLYGNLATCWTFSLVQANTLTPVPNPNYTTATS